MAANLRAAELAKEEWSALMTIGRSDTAESKNSSPGPVDGKTAVFGFVISTHGLPAAFLAQSAIASRVAAKVFG